MKLLSGIKSFIYKADFFYTAELLRYKQEPEYRTLLGGVMSISIIIALIITFYSKVIDTLDKIIINANSQNTDAPDPIPYIIESYPKSDFMFGVQIWHHNLNEGPRYFDVVLTNAYFDTGEKNMDESIQYPLEPCTRQHWQSFPSITNNFDRLSMNYWLCLPMNKEFQIKGKYASVVSKTLQVAVKKCTNSTKYARDCAPQADIDTFIEDNGDFFFTIYFINPLINPSSQEYLSSYLEDNNYIIFSKNFGSEGVLFMQDFTIQSDNSIIPITTTQIDQGAVVEQFALKNPYHVSDSTEVYCFFSFFKSAKSQSYKRSFQKLDEILSYIGGLFGTIAIGLFLVNAYNSYSFQITLGTFLFTSKDRETDDKFRRYNFLDFIIHLLYAFLRTIGLNPNWKSTKEYVTCREEMLRQLDILYLIKRVSFLERGIEFLFDKHQLKSMYFLDKLSLEEASKSRKRHRSKIKFIRDCKKTQSCNNISRQSNLKLVDEIKFLPQNSSKMKNNDNQHDVSSLEQNRTRQLNNKHSSMNLFKSNKVISQHLKHPEDISDSQSDSQPQQQSSTCLLKLREAALIHKKPTSMKIWSSLDPFVAKEITKIEKDNYQNYQMHHIVLTNEAPEIKNLTFEIQQNDMKNQCTIEAQQQQNWSWETKNPKERKISNKTPDLQVKSNF